jgi:hypothetical protein
MTVTAYSISILADYFQFVLMDEQSDDDFATIWTDEALARMLAVGRCAVCPGTLRNAEVAVELRFVEAEPGVDMSQYDHAAEASIDVPSGTLVAMGCTEYLPEAKRIRIEPGTYQVLSLASGVSSIRTEWEKANDLYTVYLWPGKARMPRLIKHWSTQAA